MSDLAFVHAITPSQDIAIHLLQPNPWNRKQFDPALMQDLVTSIKAVGILEPLIVRQKGEVYEIASGNRRYLAAKEAGLSEVPCEIETLTDEQVQDMNLITNIQREEINPLEKAKMIQARMESGHYNQDEMAARLGKSRPWLTEVLGFLSLPDEVQQNVAEVALGVRPLRAIASLSNRKHQIQVSKELKDGTLKPASVHRRVKQLQQKKAAAPTTPAPTVPAAALASPIPTHQLLTALKDDVADQYLPSFGKVGGVMRSTLDRAWAAPKQHLFKWGLTLAVISWLWHPVMKTITYCFTRFMHVEVNQAINKNTIPTLASGQKLSLNDLSTVPAPTGLRGELRSGQKILFAWEPVPHCFYNMYSRPSWNDVFTKENVQPLQHATALWTNDSGRPDVYHFVVTAVNAQDQESVYSPEFVVDTRPKP